MRFGSLFFAILFTFSSAYADVSGFVKLNYFNHKSKHDSKQNNEIHQENRISILKSINKNLIFEGAYQVIQIYSELNSSDIIRRYDNQKRAYRVGDFNSNLVKSENNYFLNHNLDMITLSWTGEVSSFVFGRQQIAFGNARTVNPTDVFTPFSFSAVDTEVRNGVDAIRFRRQIGAMGEFDVGVILGKDAKGKKSAAYGSIKMGIGDYEVRPMAAIFQEAQMLGLDLGASKWGASIWLESAWVKPKEEPSYFRSVLGGEYQIMSNASLFLEYHFNGAGKSKPSKYTELNNNFAYQKGGVFLFGKNYLNAGSSIQITPLHTLTPIVMTNLDDKSLFANLSWEWNASDNVYFNLGLLLSLGKTSDSSQSIKSEFGAIPSTIFTRLRYYF